MHTETHIKKKYFSKTQSKKSQNLFKYLFLHETLKLKHQPFPFHKIFFI